MNSRSSVKRHRSISIRLPLLFIASFLLIITIVVVLVYIRFHNRTVEDYEQMGISATTLMAQEYDADKTQQYMEENFHLKEYKDIREHLIFLKNNYPDVMYMYIYHFVPEGGEVIFDLDSDYSLDADPPGTIYELDYALVPYRDALCRGEQIPVLTGDTEDGYMLTYMQPVFDSSGKYSCHMCVDFSMETLRNQDIHFVLGLFAVLAAVVLLIAVIDIMVMRKTITGPINRMKQATDSFSYTNETDHQQNIKIMEQLDIRTGDEIEDIYHLFVTFMKNNLVYMQNLSKAENDIRNKDAQIGQISQEAYRDTLTGVGSKAAYAKKSEELNAAISNDVRDLSVVMVDMNNLKQINDEHGHKEGDAYIKGCCHLICENYKHSPVFRIGGDEFVVILQGQDYENRTQLADSLRAAFAESYAQTAQEPWLRFSAALGTADCTPDDASVEQILKRADEAMYEEKKQFKKKYGSYR